VLIEVLPSPDFLITCFVPDSSGFFVPPGAGAMNRSTALVSQLFKEGIAGRAFLNGLSFRLIFLLPLRIEHGTRQKEYSAERNFYAEAACWRARTDGVRLSWWV
jgi:hypothetical protein